MALNITGNVITALKRANRVLIITGAGISAESGIPTFRGAEGLWRNLRPEDLATPQAFQKDPKMVWEWYDSRRQACAKAQPNTAHHIVAVMERFYHHLSVVTQNVDGLHLRAGSRRITEMHGSLWRAQCLACGSVVPLERTTPTELPPRHDGCGGLLRPGVLWFGEKYEAAALEEAFSFAEDAQLVIAIGTSGGVSLPVDLAVQARQAGATIIEINTERTSLSRIAHERLEGRAGEILPELWKRAQLSYLADEIESVGRGKETGRLIVGISGPPGAGKTTLAKALAKEFRGNAVYMPMDGFHFTNSRLDQMGLRERKGAPETFDQAAFEQAVADLKKGDNELKLPVYNREIHDPVPEAFVVYEDTPIVILEGNYLFNWPAVRDALDLRIYVDCDDALARADVIARHCRGGASMTEAAQKYETNDRLNRDTAELARHHGQIKVLRDEVGWTVQRVK